MRLQLSLLLMLLSFCAIAQKTILITNVKIFNGKDNKTINGHVLITGDAITKISTEPIPTNKSAMTTIIDGKGKFLMPGLIDAHVHTMFESIQMGVGLTSDIGYVNIVAAKAAENQLLRGFTAVRDLGGSSFSLKRSIDEGYVKGPRIFPSGATISQTSGHGDFGAPTDVPKDPSRPLSYIEKSGQTIVADGVDQVLIRTREQLRQGATQIKIMAGGGVSSSYDPLDVAQYTEEEINAAVRAAAGWNTYVTVHAYTTSAVQAAIKAGVKCIDHGHLIDDATAKMMADKGIWWSMQPFQDDEDAAPFPEGSDARKKYLEMVNGTENAYKLAKKYNIKLAFGTDILFDPKLAKRQGAQLAKMVKWFTAFEILKMATSDNASLLEMSGPRNPYRKKLGVIEVGAYADLILVDGNPLENIQLVSNPEKNFVLIMKNGELIKNIL
ncbi:MAG TPA: amidohydrolase family protein [Sediminibacterium sp.]|nr:MAG: hydrolase [Sphingobacteriia bacterium 39-39-8]HQR94044.1 amidohydrolase family protein [Sediminibacterium sp.]HQS56273.1 amidohydrolase family protein [Sediminibacterium sp.]